MNASALAQTLTFSNLSGLANLEGISEEDALTKPKQFGNSANWICGHILSVRDNVSKHLGCAPFLTESEAKMYSRGSDGIVTSSNAAPLSRLVEGLQATAADITAKVAALTPDKLSQDLGSAAFPAPAQNTSLAALLGILVLHDSYHAGQLGLLRRILGKEPAIR